MQICIIFLCIFSYFSCKHGTRPRGQPTSIEWRVWWLWNLFSLVSSTYVIDLQCFYFFFECKSVLITCNYCQSTCWRWSDSSNAMRCFSRWTDVDTSLLSWSNKISKIKSQPRFALVYCFCLIFPIIEFAVWTHESEEISFWAAAAQSWS